MGHTPIYDQLRGERINAEVPATGADPQPLNHPGTHHRLADPPIPPAVFEPLDPGTGLSAHQHHPLRAFPDESASGLATPGCRDEGTASSPAPDRPGATRPRRQRRPSIPRS